MAINKIIVAVDFSDCSLPSVQYAAHLAKGVGAELLLVNVYEQREIDMLRSIHVEQPKFSFEKYLEEKLADRRQHLADLIESSNCINLGIKASAMICQGVPHLELLKEIVSQKADLLVIGTKGRSNLVDTIVGSCAQKLFHRSPIPVLSIRGKG